MSPFMTMMAGPLGEKQLAAIVFSDVVGFSERMGRDEQATMRAVSEDLAAMGTTATTEFGGRVIKSTGDGLLLRFVSAADAVSFALQVQRGFAERARREPDALIHRIGVHLGDVFLRENDVMGDGVNIAARLQGEAEPGGICISQTVFDVIKGKVMAEAVSIGPRELKNIQQAVHAYQLVVDAAKRPAGAAGASSAHKPGPSERSSAGKWVVATFGALLLLGGVLLARDWIRLHRQREDVRLRARGGAATDAEPQDLPRLGKHAKVFVGPQGVRIVVVPMGPPTDHRAAVQINGIEGEWDGKIAEHEVRPDGDRIDYVRKNADGTEWFTLNGRDLGLPSERWLAAVPGAEQMQDFTFSDAESQKWDRMAFLRQYWMQQGASAAASRPAS